MKLGHESDKWSYQLDRIRSSIDLVARQNTCLLYAHKVCIPSCAHWTDRQRLVLVTNGHR
jgi:hypothetical protein